MTPEQFFKKRDELSAIIDDMHRHILDRVDACLEMAQLVEKSPYERAKWVQVARDLLKEA